MTTAIVPGSIKSVAKGGDTAIALMDAKLLVIADCSGSMVAEGWGQKARYELAREVLVKLQAQYPGQIALMAFSDRAWIVEDGNLPEPSFNTNMVGALETAYPLMKIGMRCVLISDGEPSNEEREVLNEAKPFKNKLDVIYVGPDNSPGADFLRRLAKAVNGSTKLADLNKGTQLLENGLTKLLLLASGK